MHPLAGLKVVEFEGIGPGPLAGRMLADLGAEVVAVVRPGKSQLGDPDRPLSEGPLRRGKRIVALNLKRPEELEEALTLIETADALIEGNRPGVMERLGIGPAETSTILRLAESCRSPAATVSRRASRRQFSATEAVPSASPSGWSLLSSPLPAAARVASSIVRSSISR
jgi:hypothetical protein